MILFRTLLSAGDTPAAAELCRERLLSSRDALTSLRWTKDLAIVERVARRPRQAFDLLASVHWMAVSVEGVPRGKYESGLGITCYQLGRHDRSFDHLTAGRFYAEQGGDLILSAQIDTNTGRCYTSAGRPASSHEYFGRALEVAVKHNDLLLQGEIHESIALAWEAAGDFERGFQAAAKSVSILAGTSHEAAFNESLGTRARLKKRTIHL